VDFKIYVFGVDQLRVALMARKHKCFKSSISWQFRNLSLHQPYPSFRNCLHSHLGLFSKILLLGSTIDFGFIVRIFKIKHQN